MLGPVGGRVLREGGRLMSAEKPEKQLRGQKLVTKLLESAMDEFMRVDFDSFSFESFAKRVGVNKTTLYRRWPTKEALFEAACEWVVKDWPPLPDTGSLAGDLVEYLEGLHTLMLLPKVQGSIRVQFSRSLPPAFVEVSEAIRNRRERESRTMFRRAIERGELSEEVDARLVLTVLGSTVLQSTLMAEKKPERAQLEKIVDLVLYGAMQRGAGSAPSR